MNFNNAEFDRAFGISAQLPASDKAEIVFAGRSNVGKSSLLNRLFGRKNLARVSSVPGKTITINFYTVDGYRFVDLPGYGYAKISKAEKDRFAELMEGYFTSSRNISLVVLLIDMRRPPTADDLNMISFLKANHIEFITVLTKADKLNKTAYKERYAAAPAEIGCDCCAIPFSALNGTGLDEIKDVIQKHLEP
mgnify:FL=1